MSLVAAILYGMFSISACAGEPSFLETLVFVSGEDGYHTYRIPAIVRANDGALLAFCEGRKNGTSDHGDIDIVIVDISDALAILNYLFKEGPVPPPPYPDRDCDPSEDGLGCSRRHVERPIRP